MAIGGGEKRGSCFLGAVEIDALGQWRF